jgi:chromosome segregation ATPase
VADGENEKPSSGQTNTLGAGKDLLFGWLVGRAAADLGLAQALAASEAQRVEQIKRLEDSLLAQIHELQNQPNIGASVDNQVAEVHELKTEFHSVAERLGQLETVAQQAVQSRDQLMSDTAMLQTEIGRQQDLLEAQRARFQEIEEGVSKRFRDLEQQIRTQSESTDKTDPNLEELRLDLRAVADRIARAELSTKHLEAQASQSVVKNLTETFETRLEDLRREVGENAFVRISGEVQGLRTQIESITQRVESVPLTATPLVDLDSERARWHKEADESISSRVRELGNEIQDKLRRIAGIEVDRENFQVELRTLTDRVAKFEQTATHTAASLGDELSSIQAGLSRQQQQQQVTDALLKSVEETIRAKFKEIQNYLVQQQSSFQHREAQSAELKTEMQRLVQRIAEVESTAQRAHALMVNENQQTVQLREGFRAEMADLRERLIERPSLDAVIESVENNLDAKARELQNQLAQKMLVIDRRESEFQELKAQIQTITQKMSQLDIAGPTIQSTVENRIKESVVVPVDLSTLRLQRDDRPKPGSPPLGIHGIVDEDAGSKDRSLEGGKDQITQLHDRISADIERARAELREKSGRWKVRR